MERESLLHSRRELLKTSAVGFGHLALSEMLSQDANAPLEIGQTRANRMWRENGWDCVVADHTGDLLHQISGCK